MTPQQALQYLAQIAQDYSTKLDPSARRPFMVAAQQAVETIVQALESAPKEATAKADPATKVGRK